MMIRGSPIQGVLKIAWLVPAWRGLPKYASLTFLRSLNRTLAGSRRICSRIFGAVVMG